MLLVFTCMNEKEYLIYISDTTPVNPKLVATYLSPNRSNISNKTGDMEFIKNNNSLVKVIELEDQSMRSIGTKLRNIVNLKTVTNQNFNDDSRCSNTGHCAQESFTEARFNVMETPVGK